METSAKANNNRTGLHPSALCTFEAQEVTMEGVYRLLHAIYGQCQTLRELIAVEMHNESTAQQ